MAVVLCSGAELVWCRYETEEKILEVEIEPGMRDGYQYPFISEGTRHTIHSIP